MKKRIKVVYDGDGTTSVQQVANLCIHAYCLFAKKESLNHAVFRADFVRPISLLTPTSKPSLFPTPLTNTTEHHSAHSERQPWRMGDTANGALEQQPLQARIVSNNWYDNYLAKDDDQQPVARKPKLSVYGSTLKCSNPLDSNMEPYQVPLG